MFIKPDLLEILVEAFNEETENFEFLGMNVESVVYGFFDIMEVDFGHFNIKFDEDSGEVAGFESNFFSNGKKPLNEIMADIQKFMDMATIEKTV